MVAVGIYGATGYAGFQLVRILVNHPEVTIGYLTSRTNAGELLSDVFPCFYDLPLISPEGAPVSDVDVAFLCLPHGVSMVTAQEVRAGGPRVIDLSADFRLRDVSVYERCYKTSHVAPELLAEAVYGLTEVYRERIIEAQIVANPGCYPTCALLALYPAVSEGVLSDRHVIVDAKSGVSGAGRSPSLKTHFVEANENLSPYALGNTHRHTPEIEQELAEMGGDTYHVTFSPHLLPVSNGILSTIYVSATVDRASLIEIYKNFYADAPFVRVLDGDKLADLSYVVGTNRCAISITQVADTQRFVIVSAIDNLIKGAAGQAVQNMNVMFGLDESMGLEA